MQESASVPLHLAEDSTAFAEGQKNQEAVSENKMSLAASSTRSTNGQRIMLAGWDWILECIYLVLAIGALAAMVSVVATARDEPIGPWRDSHLNVSINTVVAILSAILTGTCTFIVGEVTGQTKWQWFEKPRKLRDFAWIDSASRGPWGSFQLLYRISIPQSARLAALTTLVGVAVNPFAQNLIATRSCQPELTNQTVLIPTADWYHVKQGEKPRNTIPSPGDFTLWGIDRSNADPALKASVYSGLWSSSTTVINASTAGFSCPGVNCTFPRYTTLGVCHQCADVSSSIVKSCDATLSEQYEGGYHPQCKWSLPTGQHLNNWIRINTSYNRTRDKISINFAVMNSTASTIILPHVPGTFTNVTFLVNTTTDPNCGVDSGNNCGDIMGAPTMELKPMAVECSLFPCARTYTAAIFDDRVVETEVKRTLGTGNWHRDRGDWAQGLLPTDIAIDPDEPCSSWWPSGQEPPPCTYEASAPLIIALGDFFWGFWNGTVTGLTWGGAAPDNDVLDVFFSIGVTNFTYVDNILRGISNSMTSAIRLKGGVRDSSSSGPRRAAGPITGQVLRADTCIHIRWAWITLPAAMVFLTSLLLTWTIVLHTSRKRRPAWKSSALPVLFHGLECADRIVENKILTVREMEKEATGMWVTLSDGPTGSVRLEPCGL